MIDFGGLRRATLTIKGIARLVTIGSGGIGLRRTTHPQEFRDLKRLLVTVCINLLNNLRLTAYSARQPIAASVCRDSSPGNSSHQSKCRHLIKSVRDDKYAYREFAQMLVQGAEELTGRHLMHRRSLFARAIKAGDLRIALSVLQDEAKLQNL